MQKQLLGLWATCAQTFLSCNYITIETVWGYNDMVWSSLVYFKHSCPCSELHGKHLKYHWGLQPGWPLPAQNNHSVFAVYTNHTAFGYNKTIAYSHVDAPAHIAQGNSEGLPSCKHTCACWWANKARPWPCGQGPALFAYHVVYNHTVSANNINYETAW